VENQLSDIIVFLNTCRRFDSRRRHQMFSMIATNVFNDSNSLKNPVFWNLAKIRGFSLPQQETINAFIKA